MRLWVTRSQPGADRTAESLRAKGHEPVVQPVLEAETLDAKLDLTGAAALAFTSAHAVAAFASLSPARGWPVFVTGEATAKAAEGAGFADIRSADGDATDMARLILAEPPRGRVIWPTAEAPAHDLAGLLEAGGVETSRQVVYRTVVSLKAAPGGLDGVIIHSARAAAAVAQGLGPDKTAKLRLFALSSAAARPLAHLPFAAVACAQTPQESALLALIAG